MEEPCYYDQLSLKVCLQSLILFKDKDAPFLASAALLTRPAIGVGEESLCHLTTGPLRTCHNGRGGQVCCAHRAVTCYFSMFLVISIDVCLIVILCLPAECYGTHLWTSSLLPVPCTSPLMLLHSSTVWSPLSSIGRHPQTHKNHPNQWTFHKCSVH